MLVCDTAAAFAAELECFGDLTDDNDCIDECTLHS